MSNKVNVIVSYYNDLYKLDWADLIYSKNYNLVLYRKDDNLKIGESIVSEKEISIPNFGRCDYAFFHYIINNYNNLADYNIFTKIHWREHGINFYQLLSQFLDYDYYEVGLAPHSYLWYNNDNLHLEEIPADRYHNIDKPYVTGNLFDLENRPCHAQTFEDWYNHIFPDRTNVPGKIYAFDHAPCFSVTRELIRRHPISVYEYLLERFHPESNSWKLDKKSIDEVGRHYHDNFVRFYPLLFTHGIDKTKYKLYLPQ